MATHSSVFAWRIPGMGEPGGLPSMGSHRVGHDRSDLAAAADCRLPGSSAYGDSSGKNTGVGCCTLLQGNLPNLGIKPRSPTLQAEILYHLSHQVSTSVPSTLLHIYSYICVCVVYFILYYILYILYIQHTHI